MKTSRNQPCPCGSGKKYKECCLEKEDSPIRFSLYQAREAWQSLFDKLIDCFDENFGEDGLTMALTEFFLWPDERPDEEMLSDHSSLLYVWLFFVWMYDAVEAKEEGVTLEAPDSITAAELLLVDSTSRGLSQAEREILAAGLDNPISFWEIVAVEGDGQVSLRDIFTESNTVLFDSDLAEAVQASDIIYGQVVMIEGASILTGGAPAIFPPRFKTDLIKLRDQLVDNGSAVDPEALADADLDLRELYFDLLDRLEAPVTVVNHDGERLSPRTIHYEIDSPDLAVKHLHRLSVTESLDDLLDRAERDAEGQVRKAEITWGREEQDHSRGRTNTVLGWITIDGNTLIAKVSSAERAERLRSEIESRLGDHAAYKGTSLQSLESMMEEMGDRGQQATVRVEP